MGKVIVMNHVTLDGVMQAPGRTDEDTRDGFEHGGWAVLRSDESIPEAMGERMGHSHAFLFGRRTYEQLLPSRNDQGVPFKAAPNSTGGDVPAAVAELKRESEDNLVIMGSGVLIASLLPAGIIDEYLLMIHPLVLGSGHRMFDAGTRVSLRLADSRPAAAGVLSARYVPDRS